MNRFTIAVAAASSLVGSFVFNSAANAQIRIGGYGGVSVRAPFVSVNVLPFGGGTRVRAPFTSVNTGLYRSGYGYGYDPYRGPRLYDRGYGYRSYYDRHDYYFDHPAILPIPVPVYPVPAYPPPVYPVPSYGADLYGGPDYVYTEPSAAPRADRYLNDELESYRAGRPIAPLAQGSPAQMSMETLVADLRFAAARLSRSLSQRRDDADVWQDYLKPDFIIDTIDRGGPASELQSLLMNYEGLSGNSQLSGIWIEDGFRQTHQLLREFVQSNVDVESADSGSSILDGTAEPVASQDTEADTALPADTNPRNTEPTEAAPIKKATDAEQLPTPRPTTSL
ncbi:hypothetical protein [Rubripirellula reticaptiva]|nr:hypothetical protein [Rubripirellula reticaptiva]